MRVATAMNEAIDAHNIAHDNFFAARASAAESLKIHYLLESSMRYRELKEQLDRAEVGAKETDDALRALDERINATRQMMRQHGPAAEKINSLIKSFLRHSDVEIAAVESGFEIRRHGKTVTGTLSEGERTAVAFCYFLSTLEAENRKLSDLIVVIDDPISSLDTKALNYAFALIKSHLHGAKQLVILTHNINFMSLCVKWLKRPAEKKEASLLFIDMRQASDGKRTSSLVRMPKLIREYESEYHYLFCLVKEFQDAKSLDFAYTYLMPNAMRKVMDIFLAFKLPRGQGLENKVLNIAQKADKYGLDAGQIKALERLVQVESHADSLDDLVGFSSMVFEESLSAAQALMEMMKNMDGDHYSSMIKLCS
jgi:wobble nucleotide-excising tRNase